jgi:hypothetical protein
VGSVSAATFVVIDCAGVGDPDPYVLGHPKPAPGSVSHKYHTDPAPDHSIIKQT